MRPRKRTIGIALGVAGALTLPTAPAGAADGETDLLHLELNLGLHGQKARVMSVVYDYFEARDKGWLGPQQSSTALSALKKHGDAVAEQPEKFAAGPAAIADKAAEEQGLQATQVLTGFARDSRVKFRGRTATVTITSGTDLTWNDTALGESSLDDTYTVTLTREKKNWRITDVAYAPIPSTESEGFNVPTGLEDLLPLSDTAPAEANVLAAGTYDRDKAAQYADKWSQGNGSYVDKNGREIGDGEPRYNPDYEQFDNNCANFVSQALHAGGWPKAGGWNKDDDNNWTDNLTGPRGPSTTWSVAYRLWTYAINDSRGERLRTWPPDDPNGDNQDVWSLEKGDLLFADWDPYGAADGQIDHAMIITGRYTSQGFTEPTYSQNTPHRNNLPLSIGMKIATGDKPDVDPGTGMGGQGRAPIYYPVHIKDTFETD
ncbi:amidase domain-containing protein [Streptomyces phaeochromogenes]|uniref:amidase domain-containing protein n=1 Tax=Streptomyces phaeochromogenes TaxID=1923 RepID=UPI002E2C5C01|nr:amidase domain-containing protein [Streptomyces phaeochromogenes]